MPACIEGSPGRCPCPGRRPRARAAYPGRASSAAHRRWSRAKGPASGDAAHTGRAVSGEGRELTQAPSMHTQALRAWRMPQFTSRSRARMRPLTRDAQHQVGQLANSRPQRRLRSGRSCGRGCTEGARHGSEGERGQEARSGPAALPAWHCPPVRSDGVGWAGAGAALTCGALFPLPLHLGQGIDGRAQSPVRVGERARRARHLAGIGHTPGSVQAKTNSKQRRLRRQRQGAGGEAGVGGTIATLLLRHSSNGCVDAGRGPTSAVASARCRRGSGAATAGRVTAQKARQARTRSRGAPARWQVTARRRAACTREPCIARTSRGSRSNRGRGRAEAATAQAGLPQDGPRGQLRGEGLRRKGAGRGGPHLHVQVAEGGPAVPQERELPLCIIARGQLQQGGIALPR